MKQNDSENVDAYIRKFPENVQVILEQVRAAIRTAAPDALELFSYGMPAYKLNGKPLVYFAGYKNHLGFYATPSGHETFDKALSVYKRGKGSVQFPLDQPMPVQLISDIVRYRKAEIQKK